MDPHALKNVYHNITVSTLLGTAYGASYGLFRHSSAILFSLTTGTSTLIGSTIFFGIRECVVSPLLVANIHTGQFPRRRAEILGDNMDANDPKTMLQDSRYHKVPDSAAAGVLTGGALNMIRRGPAGILPGGFTVGLAAAAVHFLYNELHIIRVRYVSEGIRSGQLESASPPGRFADSVASKLAYVLPLRKISDEKYVEMHERKKKAVEERLQAARKELEDLDEADRNEQ